jgi:DNA replication protein DnaC
MTPDEYDEFNREETDRRLKLFYDRRPAAFARRGWLNRDVHAWLESMVRDESRTLLIGGPTGTGKSWSLWKSVETLLHNGWRGRWEIINATGFAEIIKPPVDEAQLAHLHRMRECEFLALDDLGSWRINDWAGENLYGLIDYRWAHQLPVVVTSNEPDLDRLLGDRIGSRLSDRQARVLLGGPDRRAS